MLNLKSTHRATTATRQAFEQALRNLFKKNGGKYTETVGTIGDSLARNAGVYRRPDLTINVTAKTWASLKQAKAV